MSCTSYKSLTINFIAPDIPPADGYLVKWRAAGDSVYQTVSPNPKNTPIVIPQVPSCANIEGTIQTACGNGNYGSPSAFVVAADTSSGVTCSYYVVANDSGLSQGAPSTNLVYTYMPCGATDFVIRQLAYGSETTPTYTTGICAQDKYGVTIISGSGTATKQGACSSDNPVNH